MAANKLLKIQPMLFLIVALWSSTNKNIIRTGDLQFELNGNMQTKVVLSQPSNVPLMSGFSDSEYLLSGLKKITDFHLMSSNNTAIKTSNGPGRSYEFIGAHDEDGISIKKILTIHTFERFPGMLTTKVTYVNTGKRDIPVSSWINNEYAIQSEDDSPAFWSFQGGSSSHRADWVLKVNPGFYQKNYMGMNNSDYGGGIPVTSLWRKNGGIAIGHCDTVPRLVSLPVGMGEYDKSATIKVEKDYSKELELNPGDSIVTLETFVMPQHGDYFASLREYANFLYQRGVHQPQDENWAYEPMWCAWGYERNFTVDEILNTLPKVKELGIKWVVVDDGYQQAEGDWNLNSRTFPGGEKQMKQLVDKVHEMGLKAQIWWAPLAADPGSNYLKENPHTLLLSDEGVPRYITWWDSYYLSPVDTTVINNSKEQVVKFMKDYGFDGLKLDGQHMNAVPPDFAHGNNPLEAVHQLPDFFKAVYNTARSINPHAVVQYCPCGDCVSPFNLAYANQAVASDPESSWQIRLKGKTIKALAPGLAYFGDHVELSDGGDDFATSFGIGAVLGTKFTWPKDNPYVKDGSFLLTPRREKIWKHWFALYNQMMLSKGKYLGKLYDIGYDKPETHVIERDHQLYYAFYADSWNGGVEFRGLDAKKYQIYDYVHDKVLGEVEGPVGHLHLDFKKSCLVEARPE
ncbi:alpha-galactosidase [Prolixibacter bellariivorans]|uniref:Alpha-galactosidase n=2 Tax=Prolixibacter bellariivorans TaxID=314319 RepID=A0A5M4ATX9_9BACT|nr:alpha-galactosidase [Prolixibacter bellariivorans]